MRTPWSPAARDAGTRRWSRRSAVVAVVGVALGLLGMVALAAVLGPRGFGLMTRDALAVARAGGDVERLYVSWLSHLGVLVWTVAAGASLLAGRVLAGRRDGTRLLLTTGGLLSLGLVADDLFQLHESVVPELTRFTEEHLQVGWALLVLAWVLLNRRALVGSHHAPVMLLGGGLLALSMAADVADEAGPFGVAADLLGGHVVLEDGVKLLGIACWSAYLWLESSRALRQPGRAELSAARQVRHAAAA